MSAYFNQPYGYGPDPHSYGYGFDPYSYGYGPMGPFNAGPGYGWPAFGGPMWVPAMPGTWGGTWYGSYPAWSGFGGLGGLRRHGGTYSEQYTATGLPTDEEITEMIYDAMDVDPLIPYDAEIDVSVDAGEVTLAGTVIDKVMKHAAGDDAWWIPGVTDVRNQLEVIGRHRFRRAGRQRRAQEQEGAQG